MAVLCLHSDWSDQHQTHWKSAQPRDWDRDHTHINTAVLHFKSPQAKTHGTGLQYFPFGTLSPTL